MGERRRERERETERTGERVRERETAEEKKTKGIDGEMRRLAQMGVQKEVMKEKEIEKQTER